MKGVILSAAKNPGEPSTATGSAAFHSGLRGFAMPDRHIPKICNSDGDNMGRGRTDHRWRSPRQRLSDTGSRLPQMAIRAFFSKLCHQRPDRVLYLFGAPTAVCVRCLGIYAGAAIGSLFRLNHKLAFRCLGAALALNILDVAAESIGLHGNSPLLRLLIGASAWNHGGRDVLGGVAC